MSDKTKKWIRAAGIRASKTMAQTAVIVAAAGSMATAVCAMVLDARIPAALIHFLSLIHI